MGPPTGPAVVEGSHEEHPAGNAAAIPSVPQFPSPLVFALWLALVEGLLEVVVFVIRGEIGRHGIYRKNPNFPWMIPVSQLAVFGALGLVVWFAARVFPQRTTAAGRYALVALAFLALLLAIPGIGAIACLILALGLTSWTVPALVAHGERFTVFVRRSSYVMAGIVVLLICYCVSAGRIAESLAFSRLPTASRGAPNVILIVMDTVRADGLSLYGYARPTSPNLQEFATRGVTFERAIAPGSWTLPSHASLFTSQDRNRLSVGVNSALDDTFPTLAEFLAEQGYATAGFVANSYFCSRWYGVNRGFAHYEDYATDPLEVIRSSGFGWWVCAKLDSVCRRLGIRRRHKFAEDFVRKDAARINRDTLSWLRRRDRARPFFVFLNYFDAHTPYVPPPTTSRHFGLSPESIHDDLLLRDGIHVDDTGITPRDIQLARDNYDDCVAYLDGQIASLLRVLESAGELKNTLIIVTSDHGEAFGEHGLFGHTSSVYQPVIHVPLVIVGPTVKPRMKRLQGAVSLSDLPATIAALVAPGVKTPFLGRSVLSDGSTRLPMTVLQPDRVLSEGEMRALGRPGTQAALVDDQTVLIHKGNGRPELYNLSSDPDELRNLASAPESRAILDRLQRQLKDRLKPATLTKP